VAWRRPEPRLGGWYVKVGLPDQRARYVFPMLDPRRLRALVGSIAQRGVFLKVCAPRQDVAPLLPESWQMGPPSFFMAVQPAQMDRGESMPIGYRLSV
jgi:hypothetical protein